MGRHVGLELSPSKQRGWPYRTWQPALSAGRVDGRERCFRSGAVAAAMEQHGGWGQSTRKKLFEKESFEPVGRSRIPSWIKRRLISGRI